jgi:serine/threonine-protein kinase
VDLVDAPLTCRAVDLLEEDAFGSLPTRLADEPLMPRSDPPTDAPPRSAEKAKKPWPDVLSPDPRIMDGSSAALVSETRDLLHRRLRAASLVLAFGFGIFLARDLFFPRLFPSVILHGLAFLLLLVNLVVLSSRWQPGMRELRMLELTTFVSIIASLIASQYLGLQERLVQDQLTSQGLRILFKNSIICTLILIFTYGIFVPNTWRRASLVIVPMALAPLVAPILLGLTSPAFATLAEEGRSLEKLSENALYLVLGAVTAVFGSQTICAFRTQAFRARQLNQYRLLRKLGTGGMGDVYLAEHEFLKRPCAIKLIRPNLSEKPRIQARFELEVKATARLSHWNTVDLYDYGRTADGTFYYVMEYLPGLSLQELIELHGPMPAARIIYLLRQACDALHEAHAVGLIHRDLKPPNIFAAYRGARCDVTKILDFGLVKATRPSVEVDSPVVTREGVVTGTPFYMAPEQVMRSQPPDARTDIYALGAIAYFLLTGRPPFVGEDSMSVMVAHARDPVVPPSQHKPGIPADLEAVVLRCLEKDPRMRFADAESLNQALAACADAAGWSAGKAEDWWRAFEPSILSEQEGPAPQADTPGSDATRVESHVPVSATPESAEATGRLSKEDADLAVTLGDDRTRPDRQS